MILIMGKKNLRNLLSVTLMIGVISSTYGLDMDLAFDMHADMENINLC